MPEDPTVKMVSAIFPEATKRLDVAIQYADRKAQSKDEALHDSKEYVQ